MCQAAIDNFAPGVMEKRALMAGINFTSGNFEPGEVCSFDPGSDSRQRGWYLRESFCHDSSDLYWLQ